MRRFAILVCLTALALMLPGSAQAQGTTFFDFDEVGAWWDYFDCEAMRVILGSTASGDATDITKASESDACKMFSGLSRANRRILEDFIDGTMTGPHENTKAWWNANAGDGGTACVVRQQLVGILPIDGDGATDGVQEHTGPHTGDDEDLYCRTFDGTGGLRPSELEMVNGVGMAISGRGGMMTTDDEEEDEEEAPALPLVGVGLLGLLLAGRGAWLRRRA